MYKAAALLLVLLVSGSVQAAQPKGWFYQLFVDRDLWQEHHIDISARVQSGLIASDLGGDNVFPSGFLNLHDGFVLNRAEVLIEKPLNSRVRPRIGPFPGGTYRDWDWGFLVQGRYGEDFSRTYGFDDELGLNEDKKRVAILPQWFVTAYAPWGGGTTFQFGTWFTNIGNEIGAPIDPPSPFYSHAYAFMYGPTKHFGGLLSTRLPVDKTYGLWGVELGLVKGWNNLQDNNSDKSLITALQWRSPDMATWVDLESIWGNEQSEHGISDQAPFIAVSSQSKDLFRQFHSLTVSHQFGEKKTWRGVFNTVYGRQEGGDVLADSHNPPGFLIVETSEWYGWNLSLIRQLQPGLQAAMRLEELKDPQGAFFLLPAGEYRAWTANLSWYPQPWLRIRPELRYDTYRGDGKPFGGQVPTLFNGRETEQWLFSIDATLFL
ncbi:outer membrane beta-barrel protein [Neptuniibacter sp. CAU 1671]|uniref:outer membrane beta-barrel protein n=1 Tax=Neptuniibacter sp. CAU 1671 TaxID=3032593 RepID=UPI0023DBB6EB|nr:outer membrane beta-barrel protein [Neptuniibacter sp. CAU 1671]MDF2181300.1 outer membrane beta-barrel protein [Neptuniibacter sp. CAU 1671]